MMPNQPKKNVWMIIGTIAIVLAVAMGCGMAYLLLLPKPSSTPPPPQKKLITYSITLGVDWTCNNTVDDCKMIDVGIFQDNTGTFARWGWGSGDMKPQTKMRMYLGFSWSGLEGEISTYQSISLQVSAGPVYRYQDHITMLQGTNNYNAFSFEIKT